MPKVSMDLLRDIIRDEYVNKNISLTEVNTTVYHVEPLIGLTLDQENKLLEGDGQKRDQYKQINSSTGLAVNYYKILEELGVIKDLVFENKIAIPLKIKKGGRPANLDVSYKRNNVLFFVESKFLEPYYSNNEKLSESYFDESNYPKEIEANKKEEWRKLFEQSKSNKFEYYNFSQLCRHLLALYRYTHGIEGSSYNGEKVVLQSVTWEMTQQFLGKLKQPNCDEMKKRIVQLKKEAKECQEIFNSFIANIKWENMEFQTLHYNEMLDDIKGSKHYLEFCKRYFFID